MGRRCTVCVHPEVETINRMLVEGETYQTISNRFGISNQAVGRHARNHLPKAMLKAEEVKEVVAADNLLAEVEDLKRQAQVIKDRAEKAGDLRTALQGIRELVRIVELLAKLRGELDERPTVNVLLSPQWVLIRTTLMDALRPFPDARAAAARALLEVDGDGRGG
jgi:hypothetical protein